MSACCVVDCNLVGSAKRFCRLPVKYPKLLKKWLENINNPSFKGKSLKQLSRLRICVKHFEDHFLDKNWENRTCTRLVVPGGYPTLNLKPLSIEEICEQRGIKFKKREEQKENVAEAEKSTPIDFKNEKTVADAFSSFIPDDNVNSKDDNQDFGTISDVRSLADDDADGSVVLETFDHNIVHNYSESAPKVPELNYFKSNDPKNAPNDNKQSILRKELVTHKITDLVKKSELVSNFYDKYDPKKTVVIDYVDGKIVWNCVDKSDIQTTDQTVFIDDDLNKTPKCCVCLQPNIDSISFFQLDDGETYFNKMKATFPDLVFDYNDLSNLICQTCIESLNTSFKFRNVIVEAQRSLEKERVTTMINKQKAKIKEKAAVSKEKVFLKDVFIKDNKTYKIIKPLDIENKIITELGKDGNKQKTIVRKGEKKQVVKDILSALDGIIITKTKLNPEEISAGKSKRYIYRCNFCSLRFNDLIPLYQHKIFNHSQDQYRYRIANKGKVKIPPINIEPSEIPATEMEINKKKVKKKEKVERIIYECDRCPKKFNSEAHFNTHKKRHEGIKEFCCDKCGLVFLLRHQLKSHMESHAEGLNYSCEVCGKQFRRKRNLKQHEVLHKAASIICHICGVAVKSRINLHNHMLCHTTEKKYKCNYCSRTFKRRGELRNHTRTHTNERPYKCNQCDVAYTNSNSLKTHLVKIHLNVQNYKCDICDKRFYAKKNLGQHIRRHETDPVTCKVCSKTFIRPSTLRRHMLRIHENKEIIQCEICFKRFNEVRTLRTHLKTHSNEKYDCKRCLKSFKMEEKLKAHMEKHHSEMQVYVCNYCKATFDKYDDTLNHECNVLLNNESSSSND